MKYVHPICQKCFDKRHIWVIVYEHAENTNYTCSECGTRWIPGNPRYVDYRPWAIWMLMIPFEFIPWAFGKFAGFVTNHLVGTPDVWKKIAEETLPKRLTYTKQLEDKGMVSIVEEPND